MSNGSRAPHLRSLGWLLLTLTAAGRAHAHTVPLHELPPLGAYFQLGVEHILGGFDHLVFLVGVVLLASKPRAVLLAVTAFTLAHSITLALAVLGLVSISPRLVEPLIALSVAYVGLENFFVRDGARRYRITFLFGLVHGFGFAGALQEIGLPQDRLGPALALFNLGVEAGQLLVLGLLLPLLSWLRRLDPGFARGTRILNAVLIVLGIGWALQRGLGSATAEEASAKLSVENTAEQSKPILSSTTRIGRSVYEPAAVRSEVAERLCDVLQRLPRARRAACSGSRAGITLEAECTRVLSAALASGALEFEPEAAEACIAAQQNRYASCDFTRVIALPQLAECAALWRGRRNSGDACRSSLECRMGQHCDGSSPLDAGSCAEPKAEGATCGQAIDPLAAYIHGADTAHPECNGTCKHGRCAL